MLSAASACVMANDGRKRQPPKHRDAIRPETRATSTVQICHEVKRHHDERRNPGTHMYQRRSFFQAPSLSAATPRETSEPSHRGNDAEVEPRLGPGHRVRADEKGRIETLPPYQTTECSPAARQRWKNEGLRSSTRKTSKTGASVPSWPVARLPAGSGSPAGLRKRSA